MKYKWAAWPNYVSDIQEQQQDPEQPSTAPLQQPSGSMLAQDVDSPGVTVSSYRNNRSYWEDGTIHLQKPAVAAELVALKWSKYSLSDLNYTGQQYNAWLHYQPFCVVTLLGQILIGSCFVQVPNFELQDWHSIKKTPHQANRSEEPQFPSIISNAIRCYSEEGDIGTGKKSEAWNGCIQYQETRLYPPWHACCVGEF